MSTPARALRLPLSTCVVSVAHSRKFCATLLLLLTALFALLALSAAQAHAQAVSGSVAVAPIIDTLAGDGTAGYNGDNIAATSAELSYPFGAALDSAGNLYIADCSNERIRVVAATTGTIFGQSVTAGDIYTVAGNGTGGFSGDGGSATSAELNLPQGVTLDHAGNLYIADYSNNRIRVVAAATGTVLGISMTAGDIYTVAGNGTPGSSGDGGSATSAELNEPESVAVDGAGNLYIADYSNTRIRMVAAKTGTVFGVSVTAGDIYTVAGDGMPGYSGDGGPATSAELNFPQGVTLDHAGNLYIADHSNNRVRVVAVATGTVLGQSVTAGDIYTVAGDGTNGYSGDGGSATSAELSSPKDVAVDSVGDLYIADCGNDRTRMVAATTGTVLGWSVTAGDIYTVAGDGTLGYSGDGGAATSAELHYPGGMAVDSAGNLYIADVNNHRIRKVSANTMQPTTAVGASAAPQNVLVELTTASAISSVSVPKAQNNVQEFTVGAVTGCTIGGGSNLANTVCTVPITFNPQYPGPRAGELTLYSSGTTILGTVGLTGSATGPLVGFQPGTQTAAPATGLKDPYEVAVDGAGDLYIADTCNNRVVEVTPGGVQTTVPATGLSSPSGVAVDAAGDVYIANYASSNVVKVTPEGAQTTLTISVGGTGLLQPVGMAMDGAGNLYIADSNNNRVVKVTPEGAQTTVPATGLNSPRGVAVDAAGNVYIADTHNGAVVKVPANGSAQVTLAAGLSNPIGVAVDAAGNVYFSEYTYNEVLEAPASGGAPTTLAISVGGTGLNGPYGVATDSAGNLYITDTGNNRVVKMNQSQQSLSFPNTPVGQTSATQTVTVQNIGNQTLVAPCQTGWEGWSTATDFLLQSSSNTNGPCTSGQQTLAVGSSWDEVYAFQPTTVGALNESAMLADNSLNAVALNNVQTISLSGTGTQGSQTITFPTIPSQVYGNAPFTVSATASSGLKVTIAVQSGPATINGNTVTLTGAGTVTLVATQAGNANYSAATPVTQSFAVATPSYTLAASPNTMTIAPGATGSTVLTLATTNYNGAVTLSCSGLPANAYCSFPQNAGAQSQVVTLSGSTMNVNLNIETNVATAPPLTLMQGMPSPFGPQQSPLSPILPALAFWWPGSMAGLAAFGRRKNLSKTRQRMVQLCLLVLMTGALAAGISGCGGSSSSTPAATHITPAGTFPVTVTATPASGTAQTTTITVTIT